MTLEAHPKIRNAAAKISKLSFVFIFEFLRVGGKLRFQSIVGSLLILGGLVITGLEGDVLFGIMRVGGEPCDARSGCENQQSGEQFPDPNG